MIFNIGSGPVKKLPVLDASYPQDVTASVGERAFFEVKIAQDGNPAQYSYQWYCDGVTVEGATGASYTMEADWQSHLLSCAVTNKAGTVISRNAALTGETLYLLDAGVLNEAVTGGVTGSVANGVISFPATTLSKGTNKTYSTQKAVDLTHADILRMVFKPTASSSNINGNAYFRLSVLSAPQTGASIGTTHAACVAHTDVDGNQWVRNGDNECYLDVSALEGEYYLGYAFGVYSASSSSKTLSGEISRWWLE